MNSWIDGDRRKQISRAMTKAREAMDLAYYHSHTDADLVKHTQALSTALSEVRRHARANRYRT